MKRFYSFIAGAALAVVSFAACSELSAEVKVETLVSGLSNPCGVAIQPETGHIFISDSAAGRIVRVVKGKLEDVITGFSKDVYGKGPKYDIGPLGLVFIDKNTLVVGDGGFPDGAEFIRIYAVPEVGQPALHFDKDAKEKLGPLTAEGELKPEGNLYGVAVTKSAIYVTCNGDDTKGWVAKAEINGTKFGKLSRYIPTKEAVDVDAPVGVTISKDGDIVIGQMGEINKPKDALLTFYSAKTGKKLANFETGLYDITGVAYSPKTGLLYATDFAWMATSEGGLFRLDKDAKSTGTTIKAVKIAPLDKPTAIAFDKDGAAYITVIGPKKEGETTSTGGSLVKVSGLE